MEVLFVFYVIAGYWAVGQTIFANKIRFGTWWSLIIQQLVLGMFLGVFLIPIAVIKRVVFK